MKYIYNVLVILCLLFCNNRTKPHNIKFIPIPFATKEGTIFREGDSTGNHYKDVYYLLRYENVTSKKVEKEVKKFLHNNLPDDFDKFKQYEIHFCHEGDRFNETTIRNNSSLLDYQIEELEFELSTFNGKLFSFLSYKNGRLRAVKEYKLEEIKKW